MESDKKNDIVEDITDGPSLQNRLTQAAWSSKGCTIEIRNHHRHLELGCPQYKIYAGTIVTPPPAVVSHGTAEAFFCKKTRGSVWGAAGVVVYDVRHVDRDAASDAVNQIILSWSIPLVASKNVHAIGFHKGSRLSVSTKLFHKMDSDMQESWFRRGSSGITVALENNEVCGIPVNIYGSMSEGHRATWNIVLK